MVQMFKAPTVGSSSATSGEGDEVPQEAMDQSPDKMLVTQTSEEPTEKLTSKKSKEPTKSL